MPKYLVWPRYLLPQPAPEFRYASLFPQRPGAAQAEAEREPRAPARPEHVLRRSVAIEDRSPRPASFPEYPPLLQTERCLFRHALSPRALPERQQRLRPRHRQSRLLRRQPGPAHRHHEHPRQNRSECPAALQSRLRLPRVHAGPLLFLRVEPARLRARLSGSPRPNQIQKRAPPAPRPARSPRLTETP